MHSWKPQQWLARKVVWWQIMFLRFACQTRNPSILSSCLTSITSIDSLTDTWIGYLRWYYGGWWHEAGHLWRAEEACNYWYVWINVKGISTLSSITEALNSLDMRGYWIVNAANFVMCNVSSISSSLCLLTHAHIYTLTYKHVYGTKIETASFCPWQFRCSL